MKTCIIGGDGFIGKNLVRKFKLIKKPYWILDRPQDYKDITVEDLKDTDEIVHLAYSSVPKTSFENPTSDIQENLFPSERLFEIAGKCKIKKLIFVSSGGAVYGNVGHQEPIKETQETNPISPYGITKLAIEKYALMYYRIYNLPVIILRPGTAYGRDQQPFRGQGFINTALAQVRKQEKINVYGELIRDYIHVFDLVNAITLALEKGKAGEIYNVGTGIGFSNSGILGLIHIATELATEVNILPARNFDVTWNVLDSDKFFYDTGWKPIIDPVTGVNKTWEWIRTL